MIKKSFKFDKIKSLRPLSLYSSNICISRMSVINERGYNIK